LICADASRDNPQIYDNSQFLNAFCACFWVNSDWPATCSADMRRLFRAAIHRGTALKNFQSDRTGAKNGEAAWDLRN
jgi:hypothetical protein